MTASDTPVWDAVHGAEIHHRLRSEWEVARLAADVALVPLLASAMLPRYLTWAELTWTGRKSAALDVLAPVQDRRVAS